MIAKETLVISEGNVSMGLIPLLANVIKDLEGTAAKLVRPYPSTLKHLGKVLLNHF